MKSKSIICRFTILMSLLAFGCGGSNSSGPVVIECGGGVNFTCPAGAYCELGEKCGGIDRKGHCARIPEICTMDYNPVCGCDDKTYSNACMANAAATSVNYPGPCIQGK